MEPDSTPAPNSEVTASATQPPTTSLAEHQKRSKPKKEKTPKPKKDPSESKPKPKPKAKADNASKPASTDPDAMFKQGFLADVYNERPEKKVVTRFPPEPNGFLHIGHSKAIAVNFGFAKYHGGECYLRLDDTNPEEEEKMFEESIVDTVRWLGFKPKAVTYSSDNFERLYDLAQDLIKKEKAYVCFCTKDEINDQRGGTDPRKKKPRYACPHRDRTVDDSLADFEAMRDGKYKPNQAALRMKQDLEDGNPQMWDLVAYRIPKRSDAAKEEPAEGTDQEDGQDSHDPVYAKAHYRTGDKWKVYPSYDFCHSLCDSFEGITHSLCTVEFELSRVSYEWLNNQLVDFKPMQREYGRLNVTGTVLSKRKIKKLITKGIVRGYDDPRLYTLPALRRRGFPPGAILSFVNELGVTKATANIQTSRLENSVRKYLETTVPRLMLVLDPVKVILDNVPDDFEEMVELPFAKEPAVGSHTVPFAKVVYIDRSDFREVDSQDFRRLAPGKTVGLMKAPFPITATTVDKDPTTGQVTAVHATYEKPEDGSAPKKPTAWVHWVGDSRKHKSPIKASVRIINPLFKSDNPASLDDFTTDINPGSEVSYPGALIETGFTEIQRRAPWPAEAGEKEVAANTDEPVETSSKNPADDPIPTMIGPETVRFQGMRMGYFCVDKDSTDNEIVLNRIVSLKEDSAALKHSKNKMFDLFPPTHLILNTNHQHGAPHHHHSPLSPPHLHARNHIPPFPPSITAEFNRLASLPSLIDPMTIFASLPPSILQILQTTPLNPSESQPNPIASTFPSAATGTINGTFLLIPLPYSLATSIIPPQYRILKQQIAHYLPHFPSNTSYPMLLNIQLDHDIRSAGVTVPDFSQVLFRFPFVDLLGDGETAFSFVPSTIVGAGGGTAGVAGQAVAKVGAESYGERVVLGDFEPRGMRLPFACDNMIRFFNTSITQGRFSPKGVKGDVELVPAKMSGIDIFPDGLDLKGVKGARFDTAFIENNYRRCEDLKGYKYQGV
ncbi:uncharacterized protein KY384_008556 [Bacidia gigantensis]|uniref:uncharacterized protein n=1 Tax=Bacidia gigantensis TaxID=2732470 RepID=UPI001D04DA24|nr:uncharacterized protein KY384_008556 [Bacidia gigantensis]KAG8527127.1 hypothetical protein KY384_008556 [Bacidia gigantensis]